MYFNSKNANSRHFFIHPQLFIYVNNIIKYAKYDSNIIDYICEPIVIFSLMVSNTESSSKLNI